MNLPSLTSLPMNWPTDWIILGAIAAIIALDALRSGSSRAVALSLAAPLALLLTNAIPQAALLGPVSTQLTTTAAQALLFGAVFVMLFFALYRIVYSFSETGGVVQALLSGIAAATMLIVVWLQVPALLSLWHFGPQVQLVFGEVYRLWWLVAALIALAFVRT